MYSTSEPTAEDQVGGIDWWVQCDTVGKLSGKVSCLTEDRRARVKLVVRLAFQTLGSAVLALRVRVTGSLVKQAPHLESKSLAKRRQVSGNSEGRVTIVLDGGRETSTDRPLLRDGEGMSPVIINLKRACRGVYEEGRWREVRIVIWYAGKGRIAVLVGTTVVDWIGRGLVRVELVAEERVIRDLAELLLRRAVVGAVPCLAAKRSIVQAGNLLSDTVLAIIECEAEDGDVAVEDLRYSVEEITIEYVLQEYRSRELGFVDIFNRSRWRSLPSSGN